VNICKVGKTDFTATKKYAMNTRT